MVHGMDDKPKHFCGIVAMALDTNAAPDLKRALRIIQHRGQEAAGIVVSDQNRVSYLRGPGLVHEVLAGKEFDDLKGRTGIGHVRYATTGSSCSQNVQPIVVTSMTGDVALGHNGDLVNSVKLRDRLQGEGWAFLTTTDSEIIVRILANELKQSSDVVKAIRATMKMLDGAYSLVIMVGNRVFGARDPLGFKPLCIGKLPHGHCVASESAIFNVLQGEFIRDVLPGEVVEITKDGFTTSRVAGPTHRAHCMFEWVYFARPDSVIDGREVYDVRKRIGEVLAKEQPIEADVVIPVPDSGRAHALGFANGSRLPYDEGLMKNRYVERTFIMPEQSQREEGVSIKLNPISSTIKGKRVVVVDDSIVRGTTLRKIVQMLHRGGAKEVHVRIGCPPIRAPCYYGIDMKTRDQFVATGKTVQQIAEYLTADSLGYISLKGLEQALGIPENDLCLACLNGEYPTHVPGEKLRFQKQLDI
jgi:amidophosphoribosyltransferase